MLIRLWSHWVSWWNTGDFTAVVMRLCYVGLEDSTLTGVRCCWVSLPVNTAPTIKMKLSLATRAKNELLTQMTKLKGGGERQQESKLGGYSIPWGFGLRESNCGGCPGGVLVGVQLLCLPWWRHLEWLSGLQERKLVNTTDKPLPTVTPSIRSPRVRAWLMRGSDPIRAKYYEDSPINT